MGMIHTTVKLKLLRDPCRIVSKPIDIESTHSSIFGYVINEIVAALITKRE